MATPLIVNVIELLRWPGTVKEVHCQVAVADVEFDDDRIVDVDVDVDLHLESLSNGVTVHGTAKATWAGACRRCTVPLEVRETVDVAELYQRVPEDPDAYGIDNDQIDLLPMVRENLLLAIPLAPLCRPDCPGLCPQCGIELSEASCECSTDTSDPRWAALDALRGNLDDPSV
jgi:uncharacterized protein